MANARKVPYDVVVQSLVAANDRVRVVAQNTPMSHVSLRRLAVVASVQVALGRDGPLFTMRQGDAIRVRRELVLSGLFVSNPAGGAGAEAEFFIDVSGDMHGPTVEVGV